MALKYLIPFDLFSIQASMSSSDAVQALRAVVEPKKFRLFDRGEKPFEGVVESGRFTIRRLIRYNNSFLPVVSGVIEPAPGGCTIRITMRLTTFAMVFCTIWLSGVVAGLIAITTAALEDKQFLPVALIPFGMLVFFLLLVNGSFRFEASKQKEMLTAVFNGIAPEL